LLDREVDLALYEAVDAHGPFHRSFFGDTRNGTVVANVMKVTRCQETL
jgi:hypothetical protein